MAGNRVLCEAG